MSEAAERLTWLRLARTPRIGPVTFHQLITRYGSAKEALAALPDRARQRGFKPFAFPPESDVEREMDQHKALGAQILLSKDTDFPPLLKALDPPPPVISVRGRTDWFTRPAIAMVGARNASAAGRRMATDLAAGLAARGYIIVSGLARGIDSVCHRATLETGTIAVIAGGIDSTYPPEHAELQEQIAADGVIVSEMPFGHRPIARDFPKRNRLITGLALGVIIVEAAERSGTLISARCALEQGREVMAVPGSPLDPRARGANRLLKQGASLIESVDDVLDAIGDGHLRTPVWEERPHMSLSDNTLPPPENLVAQIESLLSPAPVQINDLAQSAGIAIAECQAVLVELELEGRATTLAGGMVAKRVR